MTSPGAPSPAAQPAANAPVSPSAIDRTLARHPRALGGDPVKLLDKPAFSLTGMVLNNSGSSGAAGAAAAVHHVAPKRKPKWIKAKMPGGPKYTRLRDLLKEHSLHTVCEEANCPNMGECWARGVATIMILGDTCTRSCGFCNIKTGKPNPMDPDEPRRVADSVRIMVEGAGLRHIVITSVDRDDQPDGGAAIWAETILRTREACPGLSIEVLIPDFKGDWKALQQVIDARPEILNHNLETVRRMYPAVRPQAKFDRSVDLLRICKEQGLVTKTGIMVGIGERDDEVLDLMDDLQARAQTDIFTIGQYLQPTRNHLPLHRWVTPEQFERFREIGLATGFKVVESGAMVRSSYHADMQVDQLVGRERESFERLQSLIAQNRTT